MVFMISSWTRVICVGTPLTTPCLEQSCKKKQRELYDEEDRLERERDAFLEDIRSRLNGEIETETIMTFSFEIV